MRAVDEWLTIGGSQMPLRCPHCNAPILSRRNPLCSACRQPLPEEVVFTPDELARVEAAERQRQEDCRLRDEERARAIAERLKVNGGDGGGF